MGSTDFRLRDATIAGRGEPGAAAPQGTIRQAAQGCRPARKNRWDFRGLCAACAPYGHHGAPSALRHNLRPSAGASPFGPPQSGGPVFLSTGAPSIGKFAHFVAAAFHAIARAARYGRRSPRKPGRSADGSQKKF